VILRALLLIIYTFAKMMKKAIISFVLLLIYSVILAHDLLPHHHHFGHDHVNLTNTDSHTHSRHDHSDGSADHHHFSLVDRDWDRDCSNSQECNFPFHLHSIDDSGEFLNTNTQINFSSPLIATVITLLNSDFEEELEKNAVPDFIPYIYKGPDISSFSLRGPPLA
jgi:hypothetical protein